VVEEPASIPRADSATPPRDELVSALVGIALWVVGFVVLVVFFHGDLDDHDATWWLWTCPIGVVLGLYGVRHALRRRASAAGG